MCCDGVLCLALQSIAVPLLSGGFAATCAWGVGYPADVIKTRVQAMDSKASDKHGTSVVSATRSLLREANGDWRVLYRGIGLKLVRAVPMNALGFLVYEEVRKVIEPAFA